MDKIFHAVYLECESLAKQIREKKTFYFFGNNLRAPSLKAEIRKRLFQ